jgi:hypothetical protein
VHGRFGDLVDQTGFTASLKSRRSTSLRWKKMVSGARGKIKPTIKARAWVTGDIKGSARRAHWSYTPVRDCGALEPGHVKTPALLPMFLLAISPLRFAAHSGWLLLNASN